MNLNGKNSKEHIDSLIVAKLLSAQFPQWADLPLEPVNSTGTDNALFRLGKDKVVRLPKFLRVADRVEKEHEWLPKLAPFLPLEIPTPLGKGAPSQDYPWHWSIYKWIEGESVVTGQITNSNEAASTMGRFIAALQQIDPSQGPLSGKQNAFRGMTLAHQNPYARIAITTLSHLFDAKALTYCWESALQEPLWLGPSVWLHGDLHAGNLLSLQGNLSAVIDFGLLGVGDPAADLMVGWTLLSKDTRILFRKELEIDEATWNRGRGWALSFGLIALACYLRCNPELASIARKTIEEVLSDIVV